MSQLGIERLAELRGEVITQSMKDLEKVFMENAPFIAAAGRNPIDYLASPLLKVASEGKEFSSNEMLAAKTVIQHAEFAGELKRMKMTNPTHELEHYQNNAEKLGISRVAAEKAMTTNADKIKTLVEGFNTKLSNMVKVDQGIESTKAQKINVAHAVGVEKPNQLAR